MRVKKKWFTAEELVRLPSDGRRFELVKGDLYEMPPAGARHGKFALRIGARLEAYVLLNRLGHAFGAETGFIISRNPDTVLAPDASFVSYHRLPEEDVPINYPELAPDLAVEVKSPGDSNREVREKADQWLAAGTSAVWVLDPDGRTATVYETGLAPRILSESESLTGGVVVPGFEVSVRELFQ